MKKENRLLKISLALSVTAIILYSISLIISIAWDLEKPSVYMWIGLITMGMLSILTFYELKRKSTEDNEKANK